jgi:hypothetical protein
MNRYVEGKSAGAIETPEVLRRIAELQSFAETRRNAMACCASCN